jgi:tetratricopeptide (TPR) repeat protein
MGRKQISAGKFLYLCLAGLILISFAGCATMDTIGAALQGKTEARNALQEGKKLFSQGDYDGAVHNYLKVASPDIHKPPEDEALFYLGLIYACHENPKKDFEKSYFFFQKLAKDFPKSQWSEQVRVWIGILQELDDLNQTRRTLRQSNEKLSQTQQKSKEREKSLESLLRSQRVQSEETREINDAFLRAQKLLGQGDYEGALKENQKVLSLSGQYPPADEAIFNIGMVYAHPGNSKKDYGKATAYFKKLTKDFPKSPWAEQAKVWAGTIQECERLTLTVQKLNQMIEESKQVDIEIEEMKREKAK